MVCVAIPGGVWSDDSRHGRDPMRELTLRAVSGEDEVYLLDSAAGAGPSVRATALLARCITGGLHDLDAGQVVRSLTVGDREALLLRLRRLTIGETMDCVLPCTARTCGERMQLELRVSELLVPPYQDVRQTYALTADADGARYDVSFRLPTAGDLDSVAHTALDDPSRAAELLLSRCLRGVSRDGEVIDARGMSPVIRDAIAAEMTERDPQAQIELELTCPNCGIEFSVVFDTATFFLQELDDRAAKLMYEVHTLAIHYHWSERDILQLPRQRRARYLQFVAESTDARRGAR